MVESYIQLYRSAVICDVLTDTLEELCAEEKITLDLASRVLDAFDKACLEALSKRVEAKGSLQGNLKTYNYFDSVWQFELHNVKFKLTPRAQGSLAAARKISADVVKVICVDAKFFNHAPE